MTIQINKNFDSDGTTGYIVNVDGKEINIVHSEYSIIINLNTAIQKAYKSIGKTFFSWEHALMSYKNKKVIAAIETVKELLNK